MSMAPLKKTVIKCEIFVGSKLAFKKKKMFSIGKTFVCVYFK